MSAFREGIKYFSLDADFFNQPTTKKMRRQFGDTIVLVFLYIRGIIARETGYYVLVTEDFIEDIAIEFNLTDDEVSTQVEFMCSRDLFNEKLFRKYNILTSVDAQQNFKTAKKKKITGDLNDDKSVYVNPDFWFVDDLKASTGGNTAADESTGGGVLPSGDDNYKLYGQYGNVLLTAAEKHSLQAKYPNTYSRMITCLDSEIQSGVETPDNCYAKCLKLADRW